MLDLSRTFTGRSDQDGASAVEYGLLIAGIATLIVAVVFVFGVVVKGDFVKTCQSFSDNVASHGGSTRAHQCASRNASSAHAHRSATNSSAHSNTQTNRQTKKE